MPGDLRVGHQQSVGRRRSAEARKELRVQIREFNGPHGLTLHPHLYGLEPTRASAWRQADHGPDNDLRHLRSRFVQMPQSGRGTDLEPTRITRAVEDNDLVEN